MFKYFQPTTRGGQRNGILNLFNTVKEDVSVVGASRSYIAGAVVEYRAEKLYTSESGV
jgi:hypothetical protein